MYATGLVRLFRDPKGVMMRFVTFKLIISLLIAASASPILLAQRRPSSANRLPLIQNISEAPEIQGCGCYFQFPNQARNAERYVFFEDFSEESPLMNIDGRNVRLKLISSNEPYSTDDSASSIRRGARFYRRYVVGNVQVRMNFIVTSVCALNNESCESTGYNVTITAVKGNRRQTVRAVGGCGC